MAKIGARGRTELHRLNAVLHGDPIDVTKIYVLCSDGTVLHRFTGDTGTGYKVRGKLQDQKNWTLDFLAKIILRDGYEVTD